MRCRYCGSKLIHPDTQHQSFSSGKAVAGAATFGVVGAAAGFIGKDYKGYKCGSCGAFQESAMDFATEMDVALAISLAENGKDYIKYKAYKSRYPSIEDVQIPESKPVESSSIASAPVVNVSDVTEEKKETNPDYSSKRVVKYKRGGSFTDRQLEIAREHISTLESKILLEPNYTVAATSEGKVLVTEALDDEYIVVPLELKKMAH